MDIQPYLLLRVCPKKEGRDISGEWMKPYRGERGYNCIKRLTKKKQAILSAYQKKNKINMAHALRSNNGCPKLINMDKNGKTKKSY